MTVDEILASGRYTDRRGKRWVRCSYAAERLGWFCPTGDCTFLTPAEMRLLIERDQHECPGLRQCLDHPAPNVLALEDDMGGPKWGNGFGVYRPGTDDVREAWVDTLPSAMDAARALAVGE